MRSESVDLVLINPGGRTRVYQSLGEARIHKDCVVKLLRGHASPQVLFLSVRPTERLG